MSYRGRVIQRGPVACYAEPQSIQAQEEQFKFLARVLRKSLYESRYWNSFHSWILQMTKSNGWIKVKDLLPTWTGPSTARAIRLPLRTVSVLDIWITTVSGTVVPAGQKTAFVVKLAGGSVKALSNDFGWNGQTLPSATICRVTVTTSADFPVATTVIGSKSEYFKGSWTEDLQEVVECYYVHPFFDIAVTASGEPTHVIECAPMIFK